MSQTEHAEAARRREEKWAEGVAALAVFIAMQSCLEAIQALPKTESRALKSVLFSGFIAQYAAAFQEARHAETGITKKFSIRSLAGTEFKKDIHDSILLLRDKMVAHPKSSFNDHSLSFLRVRVTRENLNDEDAEPNSILRVVGTRARASVALGPDQPDILEGLLQHLSKLEEEASTRLIQAIYEHDITSVALLEIEARLGTSSAKLLSRRTFETPPGILALGEEDLEFSLARGLDTLPSAIAVYTLRLADLGEQLGLTVSVGTQASA